MILSKLAFWKSSRGNDSYELENVREERIKAQELLQKTRELTSEIEIIAAKLEAERVSNHFGRAIKISMSKRKSDE